MAGAAHMVVLHAVYYGIALQQLRQPRRLLTTDFTDSTDGGVSTSV